MKYFYEKFLILVKKSGLLVTFENKSGQKNLLKIGLKWGKNGYFGPFLGYFEGFFEKNFSSGQKPTFFSYLIVIKKLLIYINKQKYLTI